MDVNELKHAIKHCIENNCIGCMYRDDLQCVNHIMSAADRCIAELDERIAIMQESMEALEKRNEPLAVEIETVNDIDILYRCPSCHKYLFHRMQKYCCICGQAVKCE